MEGASGDISLVNRRRKAAYWGNDSSFTRESISLTYGETLPESQRSLHTKHISRWESDPFGRATPPHRRSKMFLRQTRRRGDLYPKVDLSQLKPLFFSVLYAEQRSCRSLKAACVFFTLNINFIVAFERHLRLPHAHVRHT